MSSVINLILEIIVLKSAGGFQEYLAKSVFNFIDIPMCMVQILYSSHRIWDPAHEVLPDVYHAELVPEVKIYEIIQMSVYDCVIAAFHLSQTFKYMRVIKEFGNIIDLSMSVLGKVFYFLAFYFLWVIALALMYGMLGNTIDKDDDHPEDGEQYEQMGRFAKLFLYTYRNSIGDVQIPDSSYW